MSNAIVVLIIWHIFGFMVALCFDSFDYVNPMWIYKNTNVNVFGAFLLTIFFNMICPIASLCYWIYKLFTVGRRT